MNNINSLFIVLEAVNSKTKKPPELVSRKISHSMSSYGVRGTKLTHPSEGDQSHSKGAALVSYFLSPVHLALNFNKQGSRFSA